MKKIMIWLKKQSVQTQLILYFLAICFTIGGSAFFVLHRNSIVMKQHETYLEYISKISQISRILDENEKLLGNMIIELTDQEKTSLEQNIAKTDQLLKEIKEETNSVEISLRIRVVQYLLQRFQNQAQEMTWLKEFEQENVQAIDYESSYYQVYLKNIDILSRMDTYIQEILITSVDENKEYINHIEKDNLKIRQMLIVIVVIIFMLAVSFYYIVVGYITKLIRSILKMTRGVSHGERLQPLESVEGPKEIRELTESFNTLLVTMDALNQEADEKARLELKLAAEELEKMKMRELLKEAQLQGLQMQIQPHFLFNTLNVISMMAMMENSSKVYDLIVALSKFLRHTLKKESSFVPLGEEVDMVKQYLYIIKARMGSQLEYKVEVNLIDSNKYLPLFTLQPLVENAFKHGLEDKIEQGNLIVQIKEKKGTLFLRVYDNGKGMEKEELIRLRSKVQDKEIHLDQEKHIGVENVANRLYMLYGGDVQYDIRSNTRRGTIFTIYIKLE